MKKYLVVSVTDEDDQIFYDHVLANSSTEAQALVSGELRPYSWLTDAFSEADLKELLVHLQKAKPAVIRQQMDELKAVCPE